MRHSMSLVLLLGSLFLSTACQQQVGPGPATGPAKVEMKTHTSTVPAARITVVHFGAPW